MVESRAWMTDHKPQKKWDAMENLNSKTQLVLCVTFYCVFVQSLHRASPSSSPVDLHVHLLLHLHLILLTQVVKAWVSLTQIAFNEVELNRGDRFKPLSSHIDKILVL